MSPESTSAVVLYKLVTVQIHQHLEIVLGEILHIEI